MKWCDMNRSSWWRRQATLRIVYLLLLGQLFSFVYAIVSFTSSLVANLGVNAPITQTSFNYFALALVYGSILLYRRQKIQVSWYWYLLLGFIDVQSNYLINKGYQYTSLTSVTLLSCCWTIAWIIVLTWFFLGTRYSMCQLFGIALCVLGLGLVVLSDSGVGGGGGSRPLLGDLSVILGTVFYAFSTVGEEFFVKKKDRVEVVAMFGFYGLLVSMAQLSILEVKRLESVKWSADIMGAIAGYTVSLFIYYTLAPFVLKLSGSAMFSLSMLTSNMWAVVFRICFYHQEVNWLYFVAFAIVAVGLIIYSTTEKDPAPILALEDGHSTDEYHYYQVLIDENAATRCESVT